MVVLVSMQYMRCKDCSVRGDTQSPCLSAIFASFPIFYRHFTSHPILSYLLPFLPMMHVSNIVQHPSLSHPFSVGMLHDACPRNRRLADFMMYHDVS